MKQDLISHFLKCCDISQVVNELNQSQISQFQNKAVFYFIVRCAVDHM